MKTIKEMVEVMQAYERGEQIQFYNKISEVWSYINEPKWDWGLVDYRVKPKSKYVAFRTTDEFLNAQYEHGENVSSINEKDYDFCAFSNKFGRVVLYSSIGVRLISLEELFENYTFEDGTPCGKEVEE